MIRSEVSHSIKDLESGPVAGDEINLSKGVSVSLLGVSHSPDFWSKYGNKIASEVKQGDFLVSEGDPAILSEIPQHEPAYAFYTNLLKTAWEEKKPVVFVDPNTVAHLRLDQGQAWVSGFAGVFGTLAVIDSVRNKKEEKFNRRKFIAGALGLGIGGAGYATTITGSVQIEAVAQSLGNERTSLAHKRLTLQDYRDSGAILGLDALASSGKINGKGLYVVGYTHLNDLEHYGENVDDASDDYNKNIRSKLSSIIPPSPIRLWSPTADKNVFELIASVDNRQAS